MGADQSQPQGASSSMTTGDLSSFSSTIRDGAMSRQDSVCSDSEVPYVSYTVNKPIGDSPKKTASKSNNSGSSSSAMSRYRFTSNRSASTTSAMSSIASKASNSFKKSKHNTLVVVNKGQPSRGDTVAGGTIMEQDKELQRLGDIPTFLPVMRASLSVGKNSSAVAKDPDILEKLDPRGFLAICQRYQSHLRHAAGVVSTDQAEICKRIRVVDEDIVKVSSALSERQKNYAKHADKLKSGVKDMSKALSKCHLLLNENLEQLEVLNNMLPKEERLEPFVWTTG